MTIWNDFNNSDNQQSFDLIPNNTLAKVRMTIRPGGYDDVNQGWNGGYATKNDNTNSIYLSCEYVVLNGEFAKRKLWGLIGLHSDKGPDWANMGRSFVKAILNSSRGFHEVDDSHKAQEARVINGLADLDGIEFVARINVMKDQEGRDRNEIKFIITPDHPEYKDLMGVDLVSNSDSAKVSNDRPAWAK